MILYPAIDLKDGQCVRLLRGEAGQRLQAQRTLAALAREAARTGHAGGGRAALGGAAGDQPDVLEGRVAPRAQQARPARRVDRLVVLLPDGRQAQVPFVAAIVPTVDREAGRVVVDAPPGLLDLGV